MQQLSNRRRWMGASAEECPYQRIQYLEVNEEGGPAWINTGFYPEGENLLFKIDFTLLKFAGLFSAIFTEANAPNYYRIINWSGNIVASYGAESDTFDKLIHNTELLNKRFQAELNKDTCVINGESFNITKGSCGKSKHPLCIFDRGDGARQTYGRLHSFSISENGEQLIDLIPVRIDNEGFMYDRVSGKLFGNAGSGRFILGRI